MKLLLDPQIYYRQRVGGISKYFTEVYRLLRDDGNVTIKCPLLFTENLHFKYYSLQPGPFFSSLIKLLDKVFFWPKMPEKNKQIVKILLKTDRPDIFIPTYYDTYFLSSIGKTPFVLTVYDMIHEIFPSYFPDQSIVSKKRLLIERAKRIIAISENTKRDILRIYPHIPGDKIEVVYLCHSIESMARHQVPAQPTAKYVLFVGNRGLYKNFVFMVTAIADWLIQNNFKLYALGGGALTAEERELLCKLELESLVIQMNFTDDELPRYYSDAFAFIFPSEYEGFGIPVLEAMACGCPVLLPPVSSFPEVAGEAGIYFQLNNAESLILQMERLQNDHAFRFSKIELGYQQVARFSWAKTKEGCLNVFRHALQ